MRSIRVFTSSPFLDMQAERDYINRAVFPELRSRCWKRGIEFVGIDLRWGLTQEDTKTRGALTLCLREIERCRPFFLSLLGDRYGWVPPMERIAREVFDTARRDRELNRADAVLLNRWYRLDKTSAPPVYRLRREGSLPLKDEKKLTNCWESAGLDHAGESITEQEISHGAFSESQNNSQSFFYFRNLDIGDDSDFPRHLTPVFVEQDPKRRDRLKQLKQRIRQNIGPGITVRDYDAQFAGWRIEPTLLPASLTQEDLTLIREHLKDGIIQPEELRGLSEPARNAIQRRGTVALTGMEQLGQRILEDLWHSIETLISNEPRQDPRGEEETERAYHVRFLADRTRLFFGRDELLERMLRYTEDDDERQPLVITGPAGSGKSAIMAKFAARETPPEVLVLPYFIGAAPGSTDLTFAVRSLCESLCRECGLDDEISADPNKLQLQLPVLLAKAGSKRRVVLLLDALNQMNPADGSHELNWVPFYVPRGTRVILSTLEGDCLASIKRRVSSEAIIEVPALPRDDRRNLVCKQLARRAKKLTKEQLARLLDVVKRRDAVLPLYLLVAVEEICLFGSSEALDSRLDQLPATLPELFEQVLERLEQDHTYEITSAVMRWLAVSRSGLLESEINGLLSNNDNNVTPAHWIRFYRALEPYLRPMDETTGAGFIDFYHDQLRFAVHRRYLDMDVPDAELSTAASAAHDELAGYFRALAHGNNTSGAWFTDYPHALNELPFHLIHAGHSSEVQKLLLDFEWMQTKLDALDPTALLVDYDLLPNNTDLDLVKRALIRAAHVLAREKNELAGQLLGRLMTYDNAAIQAMLDHVGRWRRAGVWLRPITPSLARPDEPLLKGLLGISSVAVTSDLGKAISCSDEGVIRVWDIDRDVELKSLGSNTNRLNAKAITPHGERVVTSSEDQSLKVWAPLETDNELCSLSGHTGYVTAVSMTADGKWAISASEDQTLRLWDIDKCVEVPRFAGTTLLANLLAITPDRGRAISASPDGSLRLWDVDQGVELPSNMRHSGFVRALAITPDGRRAVSASDETLKVWDVENNVELHQLRGHIGLVRVVVVTPDGRYAISGSDDIDLRIWDLENGVGVGKLHGHWWSVTAASITPDGQHVVSASGDESLKVWDLANRNELHSLRGQSGWVNGLAITPDGRSAISVSRDKALRVWDVPSGKPLRDLTGHTEWVNAIAVTPHDLNVISGADDNTLKVWDFASGKELFTLTGHGNGISGIALTPDGRLAVSGCWDHTLKVWNLETRSELLTLPGHPMPDDSGWVRAVAVTPEGQRAVSASHDGTLKVWDLNSGSELMTLEGHKGWVMAVAAMPDGRRVLSGSADGTLKLWDLESGKELCTFSGHTGFVTGVAVNADGSRAVSTSEDQTLKVWNLEDGTVIASFTGDAQLRACALTPDNKTIIAGESSGRMHFLRLMEA
jgi:WD40 repeat protein